MKRSSKHSLLLSTAFALAVAPIAVSQEEPEDSAVEAAEQDERTLQTVVVRGAFIPEPQRQTSQVASFLSAEDLTRQGDANAALALTRLSGLSVVDGQFAYVRGLGDRYSVALLNGSPLPSPEPLRRTVPLDLFPSSMLDGAAVQKTYSANYPGEFGGGLIDLKTVGQPAEDFLNLKIGTGYNTFTTGSTGFFVSGSDTDWSGYDDGLRDLPAPLASLIASGTNINSLSAEEREAAGESLVNGPLSVIEQDDLHPSFEAELEGGKALAIAEFDVGLIGVLGYDSSWTTRQATQQVLRNNSSGDFDRDVQVNQTAYDAIVNGLGSITVAHGLNEVSGTLFYVHSTTKDAQIAVGEDGSNEIRHQERSAWYERELTSFQLGGSHVFGDLDLEWRGTVAQSTYDAPYERRLTREVIDGLPTYNNQQGRYNIQFTELVDDVTGFGLDGTYTFNLGSTRELTVSGGFDDSSTERDYKQYNFRFNGSIADGVDPLARPDFLFSPDNIAPSRFFLNESTTSTDLYTAGLDVTAYYAQADVDVTEFIKATVGVRQESGEQFVETADRFGNPGPEATRIDNDYTLPALTFTWNFADDLQLRFGYSETIARPQFRELSEASYFDTESSRTYRGNSGLVDSEFTNYDARLEYYMGRNQFVTGAVFFKEIVNPIEEQINELSSLVYQTTYINAPKAELFGLELEYRNRFDMPFEGAWWQDRDWIFSTNYTFTSAELIVDDADLVFSGTENRTVLATDLGLSDGDKLQGTPENIFNLQFGWESDVEQATLLVGWVDERILQRGDLRLGLEDVLEDPGIQVDFVYRRDIELAGKELTFGFSARNLLDEAHEEFVNTTTDIGRVEFNTYDRGTSLSASLTAKF
ncbi:MAG: TonB-dependent receptor [Alphaproteobacteria bacterium]|nr:TonB-dependent receptor [Alphaproteobacteria bacterium]